MAMYIRSLLGACCCYIIAAISDPAPTIRTITFDGSSGLDATPQQQPLRHHAVHAQPSEANAPMKDGGIACIYSMQAAGMMMSE